MGKVIAFLGVSLVMVWAMPARAQQAPDAFNDVPTDHWAYQAVENLRAKNIVIGYPDGYFRGKRTLTRYEFAVALDRALRSLPEPGVGPGGVGPAGPAGEPGPAGPAGPAGPPGMTPEEVAQLRRLAEEFRNELSSLGNSIASTNRRLDDLAKRVADIEADLRNRTKITGGAFLGIRSDRGNSRYVDQDGAMLSPFGYYNDSRGYYGSEGFRNSPGVVHSLQLGALANLPGGGVLDAAIMTGTYKNYLDGTTAIGLPWRNNDPVSDTYVHHLMVTVPMSSLGEASKLTVGRFGHNVSALTLWKPDIDSYFDNPLEEDGKIYMDGAKVNTGIGSVGIDLFGGKTSSVRGTGDSGWMPWSAPLAGAVDPALFRPYYVGENGGYYVNKPFAQVGTESYYEGYGNNMMVGELAGVTLGLPLNSLGGKVRFSTIATSDAGWNDYYYYKSNPFTNVLVLGADADFQLGERVSVRGEWGKTITGEGRFRSTGTEMNNAFLANVNLGLGSLNVAAGYKYIDPLFYAPGYWGRIGNWINPTNIQGPTVRASFDLTPTVGVVAGGEFLSAARNYEGSLTRNDDINRVLVGLKWDVSPVLRTTLDWEGVYWNLGADGVLPSNDGVHPTEHYITFGADWNLTSNTILKLKYQVGTYDGHDAMYVAGLGRYSFNTFTSQVAVRF